MIKKAFALLCASALALTASAQFPWGPSSKVVSDSIFSKELNAWRSYTIYLPKSYEASPNKTYPVIYMLHGMGETDRSWVDDKRVNEVLDQLIASGEVADMIVVSPNAGGKAELGFWNGYFNMPGWNYENFFFNEFVPAIEKKYHCGGDKGHRAIAGLSMGGGGCAGYAQHHPEMFSSAYVMSGLVDIPAFQRRPDANKKEKSKVDLLTEAVIANSCVKHVENADEPTRQKLRSVAWFVDCGDDDFLLDANIDFFRAMQKARIPLQFRVRDGGHTNLYWHSALYDALPFATRNFTLQK